MSRMAITVPLPSYPGLFSMNERAWISDFGTAALHSFGSTSRPPGRDADDEPHAILLVTDRVDLLPGDRRPRVDPVLCPAILCDAMTFPRSANTGIVLFSIENKMAQVSLGSQWVPGDGGPRRSLPPRTRTLGRINSIGNIGRGSMAETVDDAPSTWERMANFMGKVEYQGDWNLSPEWFGTQGGGWGRNEGQVIFEEVSYSGRVTVTAHPASPLRGEGEAEWRVLRFNDTTRQSVARIVDGKVDARCLATEYLKTVAAVFAAVIGSRPLAPPIGSMPALCIGVGGGSMVMFLNTYFPELCVQSVEIDPVVVSAARLMGAVFDIIVADANEFVVGSDCDPPEDDVHHLPRLSNGSSPYEFVYIDAFDGDDCVPEDLCGEAFAGRLASEMSSTGTLIVNLHADDGNWEQTARVFRDAVGGVAFTCTCKTQGNVVLCCSRSLDALGQDLGSDQPDVAEALKRLCRSGASKTYFDRDLPFRCGERVTEGFSLVV